MAATWFEKLTGFREEHPAQVRGNLELQEDKLISKINGAAYTFGKLEIPSLEELRNSVSTDPYDAKIKISELVGDVQEFHKNPQNQGAFFQAASQYNLLEMVGPSVSPERGIGIYENDRTQGPACAIACGAGTIYRNYFVKVGDQLGQTEANQVDCLQDIAAALKNEELNLWNMQNGYALASDIAALETISKLIRGKSESEYEELKGKLRIGIQWDTEVTLNNAGHLVSQAYCSALPVAYSHIPASYWADFACLVLEASYEATLWAALRNYENTQNERVFLTLLGGGAFGNRTEWIFNALKKSLSKFSHTPLDIKVVSYGYSNPHLVHFIQSLD